MPAAPDQRARVAKSGRSRWKVEAIFDGPDDGLSFAARQAALDAVDAWEISGRLRIDTPERSNLVRFDWMQRGEQLVLTVSGRLGAGATRIDGDASRLRIESRGEIEELFDPERQLSERLGWWLPVTSVEHWLLGRPDPDFPATTERGGAGTLASISQRAWQIRYDEYQIIGGLLLPRRVVLTDEPLRLELLVSDWEPAAGEP